ncbi:hypothetical protein R1sor_021694 [Riccia sorocarpa]|uniref:Putative rRNA methyltransferase n=1 Tax=Riccia sorocarpa TaxID=122646 RepID=A0ABD3GHT4_9MARC
MGKHKTKTTGKGRLDKFYYLAKEQGFRSRAAFKLVQLDRKYHFLSNAHSVLDLCAAPGGWMQVCAKHMPVGSLIVGVDLVPIRAIRGAHTLVQDITTSQCRAAIKKLLKEQGHNVIQVVLHDGSPNVGGAWSSEATSQSSLVLDSLKLATEFLGPGGTFVSKVFRSQDYTALLYAFKQLFEKVEVTKPVASRATSAEIYVVGLKYKAPAKIDPRLLDHRHLFKQVEEPAKVVDVLGVTKQKRHRDGYEDGVSTLRKEVSASEFVWTEKPLELLGTVTSMSFSNEESKAISEHSLTTQEIKNLCDDLRVINKQDFKLLLKWRLKVRDAFKVLDKDDEEDDEEDEEKCKSDEEEKGASKATDEEKLLTEMEELKEHMEAKKKKAKKIAAKRKAKMKARSATGMQIDVMEDQEMYGDEDLFSLGAIKAKKDLARVEEASSDEDVEGDVYMSDDEDMLNTIPATEADSDVDFDEDRARYDAELDKALEEAYERYVKDTDGSSKRRRRARLNDEEGADLFEEGKEPEYVGNGKEEDGDANPLLMPLVEKIKKSTEQVAKQWFSQDIFSDFKDPEEQNGVAPVVDKASEKKRKREDKNGLTKGPNGVVKSTNGVVSRITNGSTVEEDGNEPRLITNQGDEEEGFEVVPMEASGSSDSSDDDDDDDLNDNTKAETLAFAKKMLTKKSRDTILDNAYNRYMFDDDDLPRWFADDEKKHSVAQKPITKEDVEAMKAQFRAINARPVKKVAEAKARKKRRVQKKMEQVRQKATAIADQEDISSSSKKKMMERLYNKAKASVKRPKKEIVIAKKGVGAKGGAGKVVVDRRLKKDTRSRGSGKPGRKGGKGPAGGKAKGFSGGKKSKRGPKPPKG